MRPWFAKGAAHLYRAAFMKVEVENQPHCVATLKIELPPEQVSKEWDAIANSFASQARIPGYRPGKAPRRVIEAKFRKDIQDELTKKLVSKSYHEAIAEKQLRVVSLTNLEDVEFGEDRSMRFRATVVTAPEFELPEYKGIPLQLPDTKVTEAEVDAAVERLREQSAEFVDVPERGLELDDFAVIDFEGSIDGKPIAEIVPAASKNLQGGKKFWLRLATDNFLPRFVDQVLGQKPNETRTVKVEFPADFPLKELAGKTAEYSVTLLEIKQRVLPPLDDAFAAKWMSDKTLPDLRHALEHQIEHEKGHELEPLFAPTMHGLYNLHMIRGDHRTAVDWFLKTYERAGSDQAYAATMRRIFETQGINAFLEARIERSVMQIASGGRLSRMTVAQQYTFLGKRDEAVLWIEKAREERQPTILFINQHPMYASLRSHPGFQAVVKKLGL